MENLLTYQDVMQLLQVSRTTVYNVIKSGELKPVTIGHRAVRFVPEDVQAYIHRTKAKKVLVRKASR